MVTALKLYQYPCPYKTVQVKGKHQMDFLIDNYKHFQYLNLVIEKHVFLHPTLKLYKNVKKLSLLECTLSNGIPKLRSFSLSYNFENLSTLEMIGCCVTKIDQLHYLRNLKTLNLFNNWITKIENLDTLTQLTDLNLSFNNIKRIENLEKLSYLVRLDLSHNRIEKIENLQILHNLEYINISFNLVSLVENLWDSKHLKKINLSYNRIKKICDLNNSSFNRISEHNDLYSFIENCFRAEMQLFIKIHRNDKEIITCFSIYC